ncbi:hypothetical protein MFUL124B02_08385 [Myxococcus fulvus 124B02]|nr:hypothetical protein MFUL124B02_08385 [Myxococcus fulvus 124B02]
MAGEMDDQRSQSQCMGERRKDITEWGQPSIS